MRAFGEKVNIMEPSRRRERVQYLRLRMNLRAQEQILLDDVFKVTVDPNKSNDRLFVGGFASALESFGANFSLMSNVSYFDTLLVELLAQAGICVFKYLADCLGRSDTALGKAWNQNDQSQNFLKYCQDIISRYVYLNALSPEMFPDQLEMDAHAKNCDKPVEALAMRVLALFETNEFNSDIMSIILHGAETGTQGIDAELGGSFPCSFINALLMRMRFPTILDNKAFVYIGILKRVLQIPEFKPAFLHNPNLPFCPPDSKGLKGHFIDQMTPFGIVSRISLLGRNLSLYQEVQVEKSFEEQLAHQLGEEGIRKEIIKRLLTVQTTAYSELTDVLKQLLGLDSEMTFRWLNTFLLLNQSKAKLGSRLHTFNQRENSHDGLCINVYCMLLNMCKPIIDPSPGKDLLSKIDPYYFAYNERVQQCKYEPISKKEVQHPTDTRNFGTVTQYFFLCLEAAHVGLISCHDTMSELMQRSQATRPAIDKRTHVDLNRYYIVVNDESLIRNSIKLLGCLLQQLPKWLDIDVRRLVDGNIPGFEIGTLASFLPMHLLQTVVKFHEKNQQYKRDYLRMVGKQHLHLIVDMTCILLSDLHLVSNPYTAASYLQLLYVFLMDPQNSIVKQTLFQNETAQRNITPSLIKFYCGIATTGSSHQFYSKFQYRFYMNKIFISLWESDFYRIRLQECSTQGIFAKFLNMVMTDTSYCFDEANDSYSKYKVFDERRASEGQLNQEDTRNLEQLTNNITSTLRLGSSNVRLMRALSQWSPETFLSETQRTTVVPILNNIMRTMVDPATFITNRELLKKLNFEKEELLSNALQIYVNLDINDFLSQEVIRDERNYRKEYFSSALQKASNEHLTKVHFLERFEELINKLSSTVNEQENEEIYGEIPEKYLCALMNTLMKDPVLLPSGNIVEKVNIRRCYMLDERDPFTRGPLKQTDMKEVPDLKKEIEAWKEHRLAQLKNCDKETKYGRIGTSLTNPESGLPPGSEEPSESTGSKEELQ